MTRTPLAPTVERRMTFEEYLRYDDGTDARYELVRGLLVRMPNASAEHELVVSYIAGALLRFVAERDLPYVVRVNAGVQTEEDTSRLPDIVVYDAADWERLLREGGAAVLRLGSPVRLVVEVTSENWREDYYEKRAEYERRGIPEYWIADRRRRVVTALGLWGGGGAYVEEVLRVGDELRSRVLAGFVLPVASILSPPAPEAVIREELGRLARAQEEVLEARRLLAEEQRRAEEARRLLEEEQRRAEEVRRLFEEEQRQTEEARRLLEEEQRRAEEARRRAEEAAQRAEAEKRRADEETRRAEAERRRAEEADARARRLAERLRALGLDDA